MARALGVFGPITSPTFVLRREYATRHPVWRRLVHIDAYRVRSRSEVLALDLVSDINDPSNLVLVEWPEKLGWRGGRRSLIISFAHLPRGRRLTFSRPV